MGPQWATSMETEIIGTHWNVEADIHHDPGRSVNPYQHSGEKAWWWQMCQDLGTHGMGAVALIHRGHLPPYFGVGDMVLVTLTAVYDYWHEPPVSTPSPTLATFLGGRILDQRIIEQSFGHHTLQLARFVVILRDLRIAAAMYWQRAHPEDEAFSVERLIQRTHHSLMLLQPSEQLDFDPGLDPDHICKSRDRVMEQGGLLESEVPKNLLFSGLSVNVIAPYSKDEFIV